MQDKLPGLKLFKPPRTEIVHRIFSPAPQQFVMSFGVLVPFALSPPGQPDGAVPDSLWETVSPLLDKALTLDEGWPKPCGELLAAGNCYRPSGYDDHPVAVSISAGRLNKQLAVFGDRYFTPGGGVSAPQPFSVMPLTWANAFGGKESAANPAGKGLDTQDGIRWLPNIEHPNQLVISGRDHPAPAGFNPLSSAHPLRAGQLGKQDKHWRDTRWPHLPEGTDARYFLAAPEDQRIEGFWAGDEVITVTNMHPEFPLLEGRLPNHRPRCFVHQSDGEKESRFRELKVTVDTIWLFPEARMGIMILRSGINVADGTGHDVNAFYAELETPAIEPFPVEYYLNNCLRLMAPEVFKDLPDPTSDTQKANLANIDEAQTIQKLQEQKAYFQATLKTVGLREDELLQQLEANPHTRQFAQTILKRNGSLTGFFNEIEGLLRIIQNPEAAASAANMLLQPADLNKAITPYPQPAQAAPTQPPEQTPDPLHDAAAATRHRQVVVNAQRNGQSCAQLNLANANLAGLDLAGIDFTGAILAGANFAGAQLQGACLDLVFASNARFDAADLSGCQMRQASLGQSSFVGANLRGTDLQASDCTAANFSGAELSGSNLRATTLSLAWLQSIRAERLMAEGAHLDHANLDNAQLNGARLAGANLSGARAQRANLQDVSAQKINLSQTDLTGANLQNADLTASQASPGTSLRGARLDNARLEQASWVGAWLDDASLTGLQAKDADFSDARMANTNMSRSDLRGCRFDRAKMQGANFQASNLMQASFMNANLQSGDMSNTNLYSATFVDTDIAGASFHGANLDCTALST